MSMANCNGANHFTATWPTLGLCQHFTDLLAMLSGSVMEAPFQPLWLVPRSYGVSLFRSLSIEWSKTGWIWRMSSASTQVCTDKVWEFANDANRVWTWWLWSQLQFGSQPSERLFLSMQNLVLSIVSIASSRANRIEPRLNLAISLGWQMNYTLSW